MSAKVGKQKLASAARIARFPPNFEVRAALIRVRLTPMSGLSTFEFPVWDVQRTPDEVIISTARRPSAAIPAGPATGRFQAEADITGPDDMDPV